MPLTKSWHTSNLRITTLILRHHIIMTKTKNNGINHAAADTFMDIFGFKRAGKKVNMRPYGKETKMGSNYPEVEDAHRKSTARQRGKKEINQQYREYLNTQEGEHEKK